MKLYINSTGQINKIRLYHTLTFDFFVKIKKTINLKYKLSWSEGLKAHDFPCCIEFLCEATHSWFIDSIFYDTTNITINSFLLHKDTYIFCRSFKWHSWSRITWTWSGEHQLQELFLHYLLLQKQGWLHPDLVQGPEEESWPLHLIHLVRIIGISYRCTTWEYLHPTFQQLGI